MPAQVAFGNFRAWEEQTAAVEVWDDRRLGGCEVTRVEVSDPKRLAVSYEPAARDRPTTPLGRLVGTVKVRLANPDERTDGIHEQVWVYAAGRSEPLLTVPVTGWPRPRHQLTPSAVALPRRTGDGPSYTAVVLCVANDGKPFRLSCPTPPAGYTVELPGEEESSGPRKVTVTYRPTGPRERTREDRLSFRIQSTDADRTLDLPVVVENR